MEIASSDDIHRLTVQEFDTTKLLAHAQRQARQRKYSDFMIVDVDSHHYETDHLAEIYEYIEEPVIRQLGKSFQPDHGPADVPAARLRPGDGRAHHAVDLAPQEKSPHKDGGKHDTDLALRWMNAMGVDYTCLFPTPMLSFGLHPQVEVEVALSRAYNKWLCERMLAIEPRLISLLYLPFNDPDASYRMVQEFGDKKGVVGFLVTGVRYNAVHDNEYMKTYALIEEMGKPLAFHAAYNWQNTLHGADEPVHLGPCARLPLLQHPAHDQSGHQRHLRALPEAQDDVDRGRGGVGAVPDAAARQRIHDAPLGVPAAQEAAERIHGGAILRHAAVGADARTASCWKRPSTRSTPRRTSASRPTTRTGTSICRRRSTTCRSCPRRPSATSWAATPQKLFGLKPWQHDKAGKPVYAG